MSNKTILGLAVVTCAPLLASAQSGFSLGPDTKLHLTLDGQVRFEDNVFLTEHDAAGDTIFVAIPGVDLNYNGGQSTGSLIVAEQFSRYCDHGTLDGELFSTVGVYKYEGALTKTNAHASYRELDQGSMGFRNREEAVRQDLTNLGVDSIWSATAKTRIGAGASYDATNYPAVGYADNESFSVPVDLYYAITPKVDVSVGYRYRSTNVDAVPTLISGKTVYRNNDSTDHFFNVGATGEFTPKLKGQFRVGYNLRDFDEGDSEGQFGVSGGLTYAYSAKASYDLTVSNDFSNSVLGTSQQVFAIRGGGKYEFTPQWSTQFGLSYESTDYDNPLGSGFSKGRKDDFVVGDITVVYAVNENVSFQGTYIHRTNYSNRSGLGFDSNLLSLGVSLRY
jgi:polysaccharide biosynthesis protein VpsM